MSKFPAPRELRFSANGMEFAAQEWGTPGQLPVLALHGWLDNCASFFALAPRLKNLHIIALDMAGHGQSDRRPGQSSYTFWDDVSDIFAVADHFGWREFSLLGHSRGAIMSTLAAGTFPERIKGLALIEGLMPEAANMQEAPLQLAKAISGLKNQLRKPLSMYPDIQLAIKARERGMFPLSHTAAAALTLRGVQEQSGGYCWSTDPRLLAPSVIKLSREHIMAFVMQITAPAKLIVATEGLPKLYANYLNEVKTFPNLDYEIMQGGHHLHMEQEVQEVAEKLNAFFARFMPWQ